MSTESTQTTVYLLDRCVEDGSQFMTLWKMPKTHFPSQTRVVVAPLKIKRAHGDFTVGFSVFNSLLYSQPLKVNPGSLGGLRKACLDDAGNVINNYGIHYFVKTFEVYVCVWDELLNSIVDSEDEVLDCIVQLWML